MILATNDSQPIFLFLGVAVILGTLTGTILYCLERLVARIMPTNTPIEKQDEGRTLAAHREQRKRAQIEGLALDERYSPGWIDGDGKRLMSQTIVEEDDSDI